MAGMENEPRWADLPAPILHAIAVALGIRSEGCSSSYPFAEVRLVCKAWSRAIPATGLCGELKIWEWTPEMMESGFAENAVSVRLSAPILTPGIGPLHLTTITCRALRSLSLDFATLPSLSDLTPLRSGLKQLRVRVSLPNNPLDEQSNACLQGGWLDWVSCLTQLNVLEITAVLPILLEERGLTALRPLKQLLQLRLKDCTLATDASIATFTSLPQLEQLSLLPSRLSASGIKQIKSKLPCLTSLECTLRTPEAATELLTTKTKLAAAYKSTAEDGLKSFFLHLSMPQSGIRQLFQGNCVLSGGIPTHAVHFTLGLSGLRLHLAEQRQALTRLETLKLVNIECGDDASAQFADISTLKSLEIALSPTARDGAIANWTKMTKLTNLDLRGTWYLGEATIAAALSSIPAMQCLALSSLQGDAGSMLGALCAMHDLHTFTLSSCRLTGIDALAPILKSRGRSLTSLSLRWAGNCENVAAIAAAAIPNLPRLREFDLQIYVPPSLVVLSTLSTAFTNAQALNKLNMRYSPQHGQLRRFGDGTEGRLPVTAEALYAAPAAMVERNHLQDIHWENLADVSRLHTLTVSSGMGWNLENLSAVCSGNSTLCSVTVVDGQNEVTADWIDVISHLPRLTHLSLEACRALQGPKVFQALARATALTELSVVGCPGMANVLEVARLRQILPTLTKCTIYPVNI